MWNEDQMQKALESVHKGWSVRRAAEKYGVPRATLGDRVSGCVKLGAVSGPPKYLSTDEEEELVKFFTVVHFHWLSTLMPGCEQKDYWLCN